MKRRTHTVNCRKVREYDEHYFNKFEKLGKTSPPNLDGTISY